MLSELETIGLAELISQTVDPEELNKCRLKTDRINPKISLILSNPVPP